MMYTSSSSKPVFIALVFGAIFFASVVQGHSLAKESRKEALPPPFSNEYAFRPVNGHRLVQDVVAVVAMDNETESAITDIDADADADADHHSSDCHCDGDAVHCSNEADEASCHCHDGLIECDDHQEQQEHEHEQKQKVQYDCHCDGDVVHCSDGLGEDICHCHDGNLEECEFDDELLSTSSTDESSNANNKSKSNKPWGEVILATLIINLTTLAGVVIVAGHWLRKAICPDAKTSKATEILWMEVLIPMFACGALLATTFFLLLPESFLIISAAFGGGDGHEEHEGDDHRRVLQDDHDDHGDDDDHDDHGGEVAGTWRWGSSIMAGFWIPVIMHSFFPHKHEHEHNHVQSQEQSQQEGSPARVVDGDSHETEEDNTEHDDNEDDDDGYVKFCGFIRLRNLPLFVSMNLGEMLHNFTDGVFVGTAFLLCGRDLAISVVLATFLHELPNQLAGYLVMVQQCGMNPFVALLVNFAFGLSMTFGGLIVLVFDFSDVAIGCILAIGGGTFLHVAISELLRNAENNMTKRIHMLYSFLAFLVGAIPIGLILLNHQHC